MTKIAETVCIHCGGSELVRVGKYYGKNCSKQRLQCKACRSFFRVDIPHKGNVSQSSEPTGKNQEE